MPLWHRAWVAAAHARHQALQARLLQRRRRLGPALDAAGRLLAAAAAAQQRRDARQLLATGACRLLLPLMLRKRRWLCWCSRLSGRLGPSRRLWRPPLAALLAAGGLGQRGLGLSSRHWRVAAAAPA